MNELVKKIRNYRPLWLFLSVYFFALAVFYSVAEILSFKVLGSWFASSLYFVSVYISLSSVSLLFFNKIYDVQKILMVFFGCFFVVNGGIFVMEEVFDSYGSNFFIVSDWLWTAFFMALGFCLLYYSFPEENKKKRS